MKIWVLDGFEFSKTHHLGWVFLSSRLGSSAADDHKFRKNFYICTFKISRIICSFKFDQRYEINIWCKSCIYIKFEFSKFTSPWHSWSASNLSATERILSSSLLLVGSEPILTWVLSGSNSGFHSGLSFLNLISVNTITLNLSLTSQHFLPMSNAYGVSSGQSNISIPSIYKKSWLLMPTS